MRPPLLVVLTVTLMACSEASSTGDAAAEAAVGADVRADAPSDAADAPACPTLLPSRRSPCEQLDQLCFYGCGIVRRCTSSGWDDDLTIDAGPPCP